MIQPLRTIHRRVFITLAVVLPAIVLAGLDARRNAAPRGKADPKTPTSAQLLRKSDTLWQRHKIQTMFYGDPADEQTTYLELRALDAINEPDLLVYWASGERGESTLSPSAHLLGGFGNGKVFTIHVDGERFGRLVLYSGAHQAIVDTATVEKLP